MQQIAFADELVAALNRSDVDAFSRAVLGAPYIQIKHVFYRKKRYKSFFIKKRSGSERLIQEPRKELKNLQYLVLRYLEQCASPPKPCVHGFVAGRSIVTNATKHCSDKTRHMLNVDIEDFFHSITFYRVRGALMKAPFGFSYTVATVAAQICTHNGALPQGAPSSPFLSNLICRSLDRDLMALAKRHRSTYTRYADDMTFSFSTRNASNLPSNICSLDSGQVLLGKEFQGIIAANGFRINVAKTRVSSRRHRLEVTGLTVNEFPNVKRKFIHELRGALHAWDKYGYEAAQRQWDVRAESERPLRPSERLWHRQTRHAKPPQLKSYLRGKLLFLLMVRGKEDPIYTRLAEAYNRLSKARAAEAEFHFTALPVKSIVLSREDAKRAVFVVEWIGDYKAAGSSSSTAIASQGSAFLYRDNGLITCNHLFTATATIDGAEVEVDIDAPGVTNIELKVIDSSMREWPISISRRDSLRDLAVLNFIGEPPQIRSFVGATHPASDGERGQLLGFPNWSPGRPANFAAAQILSSYPRFGLRRFEISINIRQGNSGGPFVDDRFHVVGIAQHGSSQTSGNDECLAADELDAWLIK